MRKLVLFLAASAACFAAATAAASATTSQFVASAGSETGALATKGAAGTAGHVELELPPFTIECAQARTQGSVVDQATSLTDAVKPSRCTTEGEFGGEPVPVAAKFENALALEYSATSEGAKLPAGTTIDIKAIKCLIHIEPSELRNAYEAFDPETGEVEPESAFANESTPTTKLGPFPTGFQRRISIDNDQRGISYGFSGSCGDLPEGDEGAFKGALFDEVPKGNLEFRRGSGEGSEWSKIKNKQELTVEPIG